jgi:hypothetical protein
MNSLRPLILITPCIIPRLLWTCLRISYPRSYQHCLLPRKYNRQRRQLLFLVCLQMSEKSGVMKETFDSRFGRNSSCFLFSFYYFTQKV